MTSEDIKHQLITSPAASLSPQCPCRGRLFVSCCSRCSCVHLRGEPVRSYFSMACCSIVFHWCKWCMFIMLPCSHLPWFWFLNKRLISASDCRLVAAVSVHCSCVQMLRLYATGWPVFPKCMQLTLVSWYVASMLCCHYWDVQFEWMSKVWVLCQRGRRMFSLSECLRYGSFVSVAVGCSVWVNV